MLHEKHFSGVKRKIERNSIVKRHIRAAVLGHVPEQRALACLPHASHGNDLEAAACTLDDGLERSIDVDHVLHPCIEQNANHSSNFVQTIVQISFHSMSIDESRRSGYSEKLATRSLSAHEGRQSR